MNDASDNASTLLAWRQRYDHLAGQAWPVGTLFVVATPIGNLSDLSLRAWQVLRDCDLIVAEDTRVTRQLLQAWHLDTPLLPAHRHNEASATQRVLQRLQEGQRVALVSDAGAPAVSDPGARMVKGLREAGIRVVPIPGPSAVITALMACGVTSDENPAFAFAGFVPSKRTARKAWLKHWGAFAAPVVMFETPHRLPAALLDMAEVYGPGRVIHIARELTKRFEEVASLPIEQASAWLEADPNRVRGEFVLIIEPAATEHGAQADAQEVRLMDALLKKLSVRDAARVMSEAGRLPRDAAYKLALERSGAAPL